MDVILLERIAKLGQMGETVKVKNGFARNFLLPKGKALRATKDNSAKFEGMKAQLETQNLALKSEAEKVAAKMDGHNIDVLRQAAETGALFGSVSARDIATLLGTAGFTVNRSQIHLNAPIKTVGRHAIPVALHPEVEVKVNLNVARNAEEAERLSRGEDITVSRDKTDAEEALAAAKSVFENPEDAEEAAVGAAAAGAADVGLDEDDAQLRRALGALQGAAHGVVLQAFDAEIERRGPAGGELLVAGLELVEHVAPQAGAGGGVGDRAGAAEMMEEGGHLGHGHGRAAGAARTSRTSLPGRLGRTDSPVAFLHSYLRRF